jgi:serine/threonine protein kinase
MKANKAAARTLSGVSHYRFSDELGEGADAVVRMATSEEHPGAVFACKIVPKPALLEGNGFERFQQSMEIIQELQHPGIVCLHEVLKDALFYYIVLEYYPGILGKFISRRNRLQLAEVRRIFLELLAALAYVHSHNIAHRDLNPDNVLLDEDLSPRLADFGCAARLDSKGLCTGTAGTPGFTSPECLGGKAYDGRKSDVWSAGVILYGLLVGRLPWDSGNQRQMANQIKSGRFEIPPRHGTGFRRLIKKMMAADARKRISVEEALADPWLAGIEVPAEVPARCHEEEEDGPQDEGLDALLASQGW